MLVLYPPPMQDASPTPTQPQPPAGADGAAAVASTSGSSWSGSPAPAGDIGSLVFQTPRRAGGGSETEAADVLKGVFSDARNALIDGA